MIKVKFPAIGEVKFYEQDRDNFSQNLVTVATLVFKRPGKRYVTWCRASKQMVLDSPVMAILMSPFGSKTLAFRRKL